MGSYGHDTTTPADSEVQEVPTADAATPDDSEDTCLAFQVTAADTSEAGQRLKQATRAELLPALADPVVVGKRLRGQMGLTGKITVIAAARALLAHYGEQIELVLLQGVNPYIVERVGGATLLLPKQWSEESRARETIRHLALYAIGGCDLEAEERGDIWPLFAGAIQDNEGCDEARQTARRLRAELGLTERAHTPEELAAALLAHLEGRVVLGDRETTVSSLFGSRDCPPRSGRCRLNLSNRATERENALAAIQLLGSYLCSEEYPAYPETGPYLPEETPEEHLLRFDHILGPYSAQRQEIESRAWFRGVAFAQAFQENGGHA